MIAKQAMNKNGAKETGSLEKTDKWEIFLQFIYFALQVC